eukprot:SAG22_NODE_101_length_20519_cov_15.588002_19_plen_52_part_00
MLNLLAVLLLLCAVVVAVRGPVVEATRQVRGRGVRGLEACNCSAIDRELIE